MKVIVTGIKTFDDYDLIEDWMLNYLGTEGFEIISGGDRGVDEMGERFSEIILNREPIKFYPKWDEYGRAAIPIRNREMTEEADMLIAFWNGIDGSVKNVITNMINLGKETHIVII